MGDSPDRNPFQLLSWKKIISLLKFSFCWINLYDFQEREGELHRIILQKYNVDFKTLLIVAVHAKK